MIRDDPGFRVPGLKTAAMSRMPSVRREAVGI